MAIRNFTLPLSRWHHVADRMRQVGDSKFANAVHVLEGTSLSSEITESQKKALLERGEKALKSIEEAKSCLETVAVIRGKLAQANADAGINQLLGEVDSKKKLSNMFKRLNSIDLVTKVPLENANGAILTAIEKGNSANRYGLGVSIPVSLIDPGKLSGLEETITQLDSEAAALTDRVAELNRQTITIELDEDLAKSVGLG